MIADSGETDLSAVQTEQLLQIQRESAPEPVEPVDPSGSYANIALILAIIGAGAGLFVGWLAPASIAAAVFARLANESLEHRRKVRAAIVLSLVGGFFSIVWIGYYVMILTR